MWAFLFFLLPVAATALIGASFTPGAWYAGLQKPAFTPPDWLFGPVWTALYLMIAIAAARLWHAPAHERKRLAFGLWGAQLVLNAAWSWLFFGLHDPAWALVDILALLVVIVAFIGVTWSLQRAAAWLFVPYALWVAYATLLNLSIWLANPFQSAA